jgi:hypothetical protein
MNSAIENRRNKIIKVSKIVNRRRVAVRGVFTTNRYMQIEKMYQRLFEEWGKVAMPAPWAK